ncbi:MAG: sulfatase [Bryobacterales bacterium]|nr:sulfatase [Bryobacterales bacterium]
MATETLTRRAFAGELAAPAFLRQGAKNTRGVILLIGDDHSPVAGCYGNRVIATPHLDGLAARGVRFSHAFCTTASCSASRSVILTGLHNHASGQFGHAHAPHNFHTHERILSIPRLGRAQGVFSGVIAKLHVNPPLVYPFDFTGSGAGDFGRNVPGIAQAAAEFLKKAEGRPFYLHVGYTDPHRGGDPTRFANRDYAGVRRRIYSPADVVVPPFLPDRPEVRRELAEYYQSIDRLDQGIGMLLDVLEKSGRARDTLVIYLGDNGMPFPGAKGSFYDSGNRQPLIIAAPGQRNRGIVNRGMASFTDILPTVIDWLGIPGPGYPLHGRSLLPVLEQADPPGREEVYLSHTFHEINNYYPYRAIRTRRYKYVKFLFPELEMPLPSDLFDSPTWQGILRRKDEFMGKRRTAAVLRHAGEELYDLENDPEETTSLAASEAHAALLQELRGKVRKFREETGDPWLIVDRQREGS